MSRTRTSVVLAVLVLASVAAGACTLFEEREIKERVAFSQVRPPVAFEMLRDAPNTPILDLRTAEEFTGEKGHIKGARNVPLDELPQRLDQLAPLKDRTFLIYCGTETCGEQALQALLEAGYEEAILLDGGIEAWMADGFGTVTGPPPPMEFPPPRTERAEID